MRKAPLRKAIENQDMFDRIGEFLRFNCPQAGSWCKGGAIPEDARRYPGISTKPCPHYFNGCTHSKQPRNQTDAIQVYHAEDRP